MAELGAGGGGYFGHDLFFVDRHTNKRTDSSLIFNYSWEEKILMHSKKKKRRRRIKRFNNQKITFGM